jgi:hypothetical protein
MPSAAISVNGPMMLDKPVEGMFLYGNVATPHIADE